MNRIGSGRWGRLAAMVLVAVALSACTQTKAFRTSGKAGPRAETARVLLMPPDVEAYEVTAGGLLEPNAAWSEAARRNLARAIGDILAERNARLVHYETLAEGVALLAPEHRQLVKLHDAVGRAIMLHKYVDRFQLPTKDDAFDWTLGEGVAALRENYAADYALFVVFRDSFASAGRVAVIAVAALFGVGVGGGQQLGFASLVDLETGEIEWFNIMQSGVGDVREAEGARQAAADLLDELPL